MGSTNATASGNMNVNGDSTWYYPSWYDQWGSLSATATSGDDNRYMGVASSRGLSYVDYIISDVYTSAVSINTGGYSPSYGGSLYSLSISSNTTSFNLSKTTSAYNVSFTYNSIDLSGNLIGRNTTGTMRTNNGSFYYTANKKNTVFTQPVKVSGNLYMISQSNYNSRTTNKTETTTDMRYCSVNEFDSHGMNIQKKWYLTPARSNYSKESLYIDFFKTNYDLGVKLYEGLPLTKSDKAGVLTFTVNFSSSPAGSFCIRKSPFTNTDVAEPECTFIVDKGTANERKTNNYSPTEGNHTITMDINSAEVYYVKYIPTTEGASYLINSDLIAKISS